MVLAKASEANLKPFFTSIYNLSWLYTYLFILPSPPFLFLLIIFFNQDFKGDIKYNQVIVSKVIATNTKQYNGNKLLLLVFQEVINEQGPPVEVLFNKTYIKTTIHLILVLPKLATNLAISQQWIRLTMNSKLNHTFRPI